MRIVLIRARGHQSCRQVKGHGFVQRQLHVGEVMITVNGQFSIGRLVDTELIQVWQIAIDRGAMHPHPSGDLHLGQPLWMFQQQRLNL